MNYILSTTHPDRVVDFDVAGNRKWMQMAEFIQLNVLGSSLKDDTGIVEFNAHYKMGGKTHVHHERARFSKVGQIWFYLLE